MKPKRNKKRRKHIPQHEPNKSIPPEISEDGPDHSPKDAHGHEDHATSEKETPMPMFWKQFFRNITIADTIIAISTVFIAAATCIYTHYSRQQWIAAKQAINDNEKALVISNRAYVCAKSSRFFQTEMIDKIKTKIIGSSKLQLKVGDTPAIEVILANSGNTPANNLRTFGITQIESGFPSDIRPTGSLDLQSVAVLAKDVESPVHIIFRPISPEEMAAINAGTKFLWIAGNATYDDTFGNSRTTTFCSYYDRNGFEMIACPTNNTCP